jgi:hypothetical protein
MAAAGDAQEGVMSGGGNEDPACKNRCQHKQVVLLRTPEGEG